ncbi:MAG: hypothetical protein QG670_1700 [Thermoproteota archaeon]|nr:hypothetical protein [Thermoproteota archaeon]
MEYWSTDRIGHEELPHQTLTGIRLDKTAPSGTIVINSGNAYTVSTSVTLSLTYADASSGVYQVRYSNDGVWDAENWEDPTPTRAWTITSGDGTRTVYYQIKDIAGLESTTYSDTVVLSVVIPEFSTMAITMLVFTILAIALVLMKIDRSK